MTTDDAYTLSVPLDGTTLTVRPPTEDQVLVLTTLGGQETVRVLGVAVKILRHCLRPDDWNRVSDRWLDADDALGVRDIVALFESVVNAWRASVETPRTVAVQPAPAESQWLPCQECGGHFHGAEALMEHRASTGHTL